MRFLNYAAVFASLATGLIGGRSERPNIVIILADDMGWKDVGYHGAEFPTPSIDRIASEGVELDRFYATPICTPTRAGLMTGRYPLRFGLQRVTVKTWGTRAIPDDEIMIPAALEKAGYGIRAIAGKWHLGWQRRANHPLSKGFTSYLGHSGGGIGFFTHATQGLHDWHRNWELNYEPGYSTELIGQEAVRVIEEADGSPNPFFLYVSFNAIHTPNDYLQKHYDRFPQITDTRRREKAAMMTSMDEQIGHILDALDRTGAAPNTFLLFLSDNGASLPNGSLSAPLRDGKWSVYEGGIRVAAAARWPAGGLEGGRKLEEPLSYIDVHPTILRIAGAERLGKPFDGEDVLDVLRGEKERGDWEFHSYFQGQRIPQNVEDPDREIPYERNAVNTRDWKLVRLGPSLRLVDDPAKEAFVELYRIEEDPREANDIAVRYPEVVTDLLQRMQRFRATQKAVLDHVDIRPPDTWRKPLDLRIPD